MNKFATFFKKLYIFYRHDCCWPYSLSFYLTLIIYWMDMKQSKNVFPTLSVLAYAILFAYWGYNKYEFKKLGTFGKKDDAFFMTWLRIKITVWFIVLMGVFIFFNL